MMIEGRTVRGCPRGGEAKQPDDGQDESRRRDIVELASWTASSSSASFTRHLSATQQRAIAVGLNRVIDAHDDAHDTVELRR